MTIGQFAQDSVDSEIKVPRHGSIYDRLEKARAQRLKTMAPQAAANDAPSPSVLSETQRSRTKSQLLPDIKPQEEFDPPTKQDLPAVTKLGLGLLALSVMAGFSLLDWGTDGRQTNETAPVTSAAETGETNFPASDDPARVADVSKVSTTASDGLPLVPSAPSEPIVIEAQQDTQSLNVPTPSTAVKSAQP